MADKKLIRNAPLADGALIFGDVAEPGQVAQTAADTSAVSAG